MTNTLSILLDMAETSAWLLI